VAAICLNDDSGAIVLLDQAARAWRELQDSTSVTFALNQAGWASLHIGDYTRSKRCFEENLGISRALGDKLAMVECLDGLAATAAVLHDAERAAQLFGASDNARRALGAPMPPSSKSRFDICVAITHDDLGEDAFNQAQARGRSMTLEQATELALGG
jgi:hypothetical protein